jgi:hypothetical protein
MKWIIILLSCCSCFGQAFSFADPTVASFGGAPAAGNSGLSNLLAGATDGYPVYVDYTADNYASNATSAVITDNWTNHLDGTSVISDHTKWALIDASVLNGHKGIHMPSSVGSLTNQVYTLPSPHEVWAVAAITNISNPTIFDSISAAQRNAGVGVSPNFRMQSIGGSVHIDGSLNNMTNRYMMFRFNFTDGASQWWTNGISVVSGNLATNVVSGLVILNGQTLSGAGNVSLVALRVFATNLSAGAVSTMSNYIFTNYFPSGFP